MSLDTKRPIVEQSLEAGRFYLREEGLERRLSQDSVDSHENGEGQGHLQSNKLCPCERRIWDWNCKDWWSLCVGDGNIKENIHVICWKSVDFISVKNIQVVVVDSWKKWLNFVSSVYVMILFIEKKKTLQILSMMI